MGRNQRAILAALSNGVAMTSRELAPYISSNEGDGARAAVVGMIRRGINIEVDRIGGGREVQNSYRLLQFPDKPWLPVAGIPIYVDLMYRGDLREDEVRALVEEHLEVVARRGRAA